MLKHTSVTNIGKTNTNKKAMPIKGIFVSNDHVLVYYAPAMDAVCVIRMKDQFCRVFSGWKTLRSQYDSYADVFDDSYDFESTCEYFEPLIGNLSIS